MLPTHAQHEKGAAPPAVKVHTLKREKGQCGLPVAAQADAAYKAAQDGDLEALKRALQPPNDVAAQVGYNYPEVDGPLNTKP